MQKFKKKLIVMGSVGIVIAGSLGYNLLNEPDDFQVDQNKKEMIAMYVQDEEGNYQMSNSKEFPKEGYVLNIKKSTCKNGGILSQDPTTKMISLKVSHADACNLYFDKDIPNITTGEEALEYLNIKVNPTNKTTGFETPATTDETANGLFSMEDDYGTSYYYRGTAPNNYVKFGKNASGQDMWWRIIRFNGDGSIRMQYDGAGASGTNTYTRDFALTSQVWNSKQDDAKYVGWMFGGAQGVASTSKEGAQRNETSSPIKIAVDAWYKGNIVDTGYGNYVHDAIFCNDRSTPGKNVTGLTSDTGLGYGKNETGYGALGRFMTGNNGTNLGSHLNPKPQFTCPQENDKFTVSTVKGNGSLEYPVGLITADEIVAAGSGKYDTANESYYLYKGWRYWSFSPRYMQIGYYTYTYMFYISSSGSLNGYSDLHYDNKVAPVINIKPEYISHLEGSGTIDSPWTLK